MASKYKETKKVAIEGFLKAEKGQLVLEVDEAGDINLREVLEKFNGMDVKINIGTTEDLA